MTFATLSSRMSSAARSGIRYCGGEGFEQCNHAVEGLRGEKDIQNRVWHFEKKKSEILKILFLFLYLQKQNR